MNALLLSQKVYPCFPADCRENEKESSRGKKNQHDTFANDDSCSQKQKSVS